VPDEIVPPRAGIRLSDAEREQVVGWLQVAAAEGRLSLDEFEERMSRVLAAKTYGDVEPYLADLPTPGAPAALMASDPVEIVAVSTAEKRFGHWVVPARLAVRSRSGSIELDFAEAVIRYPVIRIEVDVSWGTVVFRVPHDASVDVSAVVRRLSRLRYRPARERGAGGVQFVVTGRLRESWCTIRHARKPK
jgi:hypothetical protein